VDFFVCLWQKQRKKQLLFLPSKRDEGKQNGFIFFLPSPLFFLVFCLYNKATLYYINKTLFLPFCLPQRGLFPGGKQKEEGITFGKKKGNNIVSLRGNYGSLTIKIIVVPYGVAVFVVCQRFFSFFSLKKRCFF
jgi:hypothetical protein